MLLARLGDAVSPLRHATQRLPRHSPVSTTLRLASRQPLMSTIRHYGRHADIAVATLPRCRHYAVVDVDTLKA